MTESFNKYYGNVKETHRRLKVKLLLSTQRLPHSSPPFNLVYLVFLLFHEIGLFFLKFNRSAPLTIPPSGHVEHRVRRESLFYSAVINFWESGDGLEYRFDSAVIEYLKSGEELKYYGDYAAALDDRPTLRYSPPST